MSKKIPKNNKFLNKEDNSSRERIARRRREEPKQKLNKNSQTTKIF